ncbi:S-adenosyl-L-methionine-dependent methyltransferases superfamily protein [Melia azedarach]|uniref:S-adenosyl-L-methionine-dependent methyltransferases superfamily protein n=1 Tax=Melia azedarach TaxID=155640 RepID=A0ACC1YW35_MELAZ|nr:S-adenosyl-L-methionine-dependent methyltransferases superfamily protein [Melia azedarach]
METLLRFASAPAVSTISNVRLNDKTKIKKNGVLLRAKLEDDHDPLLQAAINAASLRFQETHRPEPLFVDPYAGCLVPPNARMDLKKHSHHYCLASKFIDDKLLRTVNHIDGLKQVVLLTDGMDTRPYRLNWPTSTIIFDISPERIFQKTAEKLEGVGAKIPRSCLFLHVPLESSNIQQALRIKGFNGNRPSIWAIQGLPVMTLASFEEILFIVSSLAMNGSLFLGELPAWLTETEIGSKSTTEKWMDKLFMSNGFGVSMINYKEAASSLGKELAPGYYRNILFVAEQMRFSDDQMETWRKEFQRVEEEGDEEGFEEL